MFLYICIFRFFLLNPSQIFHIFLLLIYIFIIFIIFIIFLQMFLFFSFFFHFFFFLFSFFPFFFSTKNSFPFFFSKNLFYFCFLNRKGSDPPIVMLTYSLCFLWIESVCGSSLLVNKKHFPVHT